MSSTGVKAQEERMKYRFVESEIMQDNRILELELGAVHPILPTLMSDLLRRDRP